MKRGRTTKRLNLIERNGGALTCKSVAVLICWNDFAQGWVRATDGGGLDEVASDGVSPGAPRQRERSVFHLRDTHTTRRG